MTGVDALLQTLAAESTLTALVAARMYPLRVPQSDQLPALTVSQVSGGAVQHFGGPSLTSSIRVQISCWDLTYTGAKELSDVVELLYDGFSGDMQTVHVQGMHLLNTVDGQVPPIDNNDVARYFIALDFRLWYVRS